MWLLFFFFPAGHLASYFGKCFPLSQGRKNSIILMRSFSSVGGSALGVLPRRRWALPESLIFLCWQNMVVFCPDSSALGSLCKRSFQSSYFLPSALPEISAGGEHYSVDVALLASSAELSEVLLNLQVGFICKWHKLIKKKTHWAPSVSASVLAVSRLSHLTLSPDKC